MATEALPRCPDCRQEMRRIPDIDPHVRRHQYYCPDCGTILRNRFASEGGGWDVFDLTEDGDMVRRGRIPDGPVP
jgi:transcription initiation factor TFIIIB Brf1 subunit/transcription initiation factor TFIIB